MKRRHYTLTYHQTKLIIRKFQKKKMYRNFTSTSPQTTNIWSQRIFNLRRQLMSLSCCGTKMCVVCFKFFDLIFFSFLCSLLRREINETTWYMDYNSSNIRVTILPWQEPKGGRPMKIRRQSTHDDGDKLKGVRELGLKLKTLCILI